LRWLEIVLFEDFLMSQPPVATRRRIYLLSRAIVCLVAVVSFALLLWQPIGLLAILIDVLLRTYLLFIGAVMAHEAVHGHLGRTRAENSWWGRLALLPSMVPYTNFRKTHNLHHAFTNIPDKDPDHFMKSRNVFELVLRAVAMPHHWFFWLWQHGRMKRGDIVELLLNYVVIFAVYAMILAYTGPARLFWGMTPALLLVSILLWYPFAVQTHEGFSTGPAAQRSHNYYGLFMFWFSLGLGMHRVHHECPTLAWIELKKYVENAPAKLDRWRLLPRRDMQL
jgi:fatty acid desaturase